MSLELIESLNVVGYNGKLLDLQTFDNAINDGPKTDEFRNLIAWLTNEIRILGDIEEQVSKDDDYNTFMIELSGFLKEMRCPYNILVSGHLNDRLTTIDSRLFLIDYLINELMTFKMYIANKPQDKSNIITIYETPTAAALKVLAISLSMPPPPNNTTTKILFDKLCSRLNDVIQKVDPLRLGKSLYNPSKNLTDEQWRKLEVIQKDLDTEYNLRRQMLVTRLDCTIQSFQWSDKLKNKDDELSKNFQKKREQLESFIVGGESTDIPALLSARENLAILEKTSSSNVRKNTKSKIQRHIIGHVPDRGGRANEYAIPAPEMPSWQQKRSTGGERGGRGGGRGGNRGGYNQQQNYHQQSGGFGQHNYQQQSNYQGTQQQNYQSQYTQGQNYQGGYTLGVPQAQQQTARQNYDNRENRSRVQGGWSQKGSQDVTRYGSSTDYNSSRGGDSGYSSRSDYYYDQQQQTKQQAHGEYYNNSSSRGGGAGGFHQGGRGGVGGRGGRSNYNRGGRR